MNRLRILQVRTGYFLGLDQQTLYVDPKAPTTPQVDRERLAWTYCSSNASSFDSSRRSLPKLSLLLPGYLFDRHISLRLGKAFWSRGPGLCVRPSPTLNRIELADLLPLPISVHAQRRGRQLPFPSPDRGRAGGLCERRSGKVSFPSLLMLSPELTHLFISFVGAGRTDPDDDELSRCSIPVERSNDLSRDGRSLLSLSGRVYEIYQLIQGHLDPVSRVFFPHSSRRSHFAFSSLQRQVLDLPNIRGRLVHVSVPSFM